MLLGISVSVVQTKTNLPGSWAKACSSKPSLSAYWKWPRPAATECVKRPWPI